MHLFAALLLIRYIYIVRLTSPLHCILCVLLGISSKNWEQDLRYETGMFNRISVCLFFSRKLSLTQF